jgi:membrane-associated phospholipid phosphatase
MPNSGNERARSLAAMAVAVLALTGAMIGLGDLVAHTWSRDWPFTVEDGLDRTLQTHRTHTLDDVSAAFSTGASTLYAVGATALAVLVAWLVFRTWREPLFLAGAVVLETSVFLLTTLAVDRARPAVVHLDAAPPTSSFPSGHTAAALALYGGIALLTARRGAGWPAWLLLLIPLAVGTSRMYRGMHHPSDVLAALLLGTCCLVIMHRALLTEPLTRRSGAVPRARRIAGRTTA